MPVSASAAAGKEARQRISRSAQAGWEPGPDRTAAVEVRITAVTHEPAR